MEIGIIFKKLKKYLVKLPMAGNLSLFAAYLAQENFINLYKLQIFLEQFEFYKFIIFDSCRPFPPLLITSTPVTLNPTEHLTPKHLFTQR